MRSMSCFTATAMLVATTAVYAHHSHPDFLPDVDVSVEGTIETIHFENPHVVLTLRTADSVLYTIEWQAARWLATAPQAFVTPVPGPVTSDTLKVGDRVIITGMPPRDPTRHELVTLKAVSRPADGWLWTCRRPPGYSC